MLHHIHILVLVCLYGVVFVGDIVVVRDLQRMPCVASVSNKYPILMVLVQCNNAWCVEQLWLHLLQ